MIEQKPEWTDVLVSENPFGEETSLCVVPKDHNVQVWIFDQNDTCEIGITIDIGGYSCDGGSVEAFTNEMGVRTVSELNKRTDVFDGFEFDGPVKIVRLDNQSSEESATNACVEVFQALNEVIHFAPSLH